MAAEMSFDVLGVDVGVRACGVAFLEVSSKRHKATGTPILLLAKANVLNDECEHGMPWWFRVASLTKQLDALIKERRAAGHKLRLISAECPRVMGGARGMAAAGRGDVVHLAHHMGMVHSLAVKYHCKFMPMEVAKWKGNLPDSEVWARVAKGLGAADAEGTRLMTHAFDAAGIAVCAALGTDMRHSMWLGSKR